jgi:hypothetical protein
MIEQSVSQLINKLNREGVVIRIHSTGVQVCMHRNSRSDSLQHPAELCSRFTVVVVVRGKPQFVSFTKCDLLMITQSRFHGTLERNRPIKINQLH